MNLSHAMALANQAYRINPKGYGYDIEWVKDGTRHSVPANMLDVGSTSVVFLGKDNHVYIGSRSDSQDKAKEILAMFNEEYGETKHIPFIEYIEDTEFPFPVYEDGDKDSEPIAFEMKPVRMFRSKLYTVPANESNLEYAKIIESFYRRTNFDVGRKVGEYIDDLTLKQGVSYPVAYEMADTFRVEEMSKGLGKWSSYLMFQVNLSSSQKKVMESTFESFDKLQRFVHENYDVQDQTLSFEFQPYNLAMNSKKQLVLLDIFFTRNKFK